jgi:saccharopine dehydrogenase-like NADP-dependent oxidoreductase
LLDRQAGGQGPRIHNLNYKTMRYLGHRDLLKFLMFDLKLNEYRKVLRAILESAVPTTQQDKVVVLVSVVGKRGGLLQQQTYTKEVLHGQLMDRHWTAIQLTTASSMAAVADLVMTEALPHRGLVMQEEIDFDAFCASPYGRIFSD